MDQPQADESLWHAILMLAQGQKATDIALPNESGRRDPRLKKQPPPAPTVGDSLQRAIEGYRRLQEQLQQNRK